MGENTLNGYNPNARMLSHPYYCVHNEWYKNLYDHVTNQKRLPVLDNPESGAEAQFNSNSPLSRWEGLYPNLAIASAEFLKDCGVLLPATTIHNKAFALCALYLLETGAVVYQSNSGKDGITSVICTKNMELLSRGFRLTPSRLAEIEQYCSEKTEEIVDGKLRAAVFGFSGEGFTSPHCRTVNVTAKDSLLIPLVSCLQYANTLLMSMRNKRAVRLAYHDRFNQRQEIVTTFNAPMVYKSFGNKIDLSTVGAFNPEIPAILLSLVDLQKKALVDVPITRIISAKCEA